jgi:hypothetical protein
MFECRSLQRQGHAIMCCYAHQTARKAIARITARPESPGKARARRGAGREALILARGARREARVRASPRLSQPCLCRGQLCRAWLRQALAAKPLHQLRARSASAYPSDRASSSSVGRLSWMARAVTKRVRFPLRVGEGDACACVRACVRAFVCMHACVCVRAYACVRSCVHMRACACVRACVSVRACLRVRACVRVRA